LILVQAGGWREGQLLAGPLLDSVDAAFGSAGDLVELIKVALQAVEA
jgi:hypothetical protein